MPGLPLSPAKLRDAGNSSPSQLNWKGQRRPCTRYCADKRDLWAPNASRIRSPHIITLLLRAQKPSYIFLLQKTSGNALEHSTFILTTQDAGRHRHADFTLSTKGLCPVFCPRASSVSRSSFPPLTISSIAQGSSINKDMWESKACLELWTQGQILKLWYEIIRNCWQVDDKPWVCSR